MNLGLKMTPGQRLALKKDNLPVVTRIHNADMYLDWSWPGCGFGQFSFSFDLEAGVLKCDSEHMSRDDVRKILHAMADFVADRAGLDTPNQPPPVDMAEEIRVADAVAEEFFNERRN